MFHWICPECGQEIAPGVKECPVCEPQSNVAPVAPVVSVEAPAVTVSPAPPPQRPVSQMALAVIEPPLFPRPEAALQPEVAEKPRIEIPKPVPDYAGRSTTPEPETFADRLADLAEHLHAEPVAYEGPRVTARDAAFVQTPARIPTVIDVTPSQPLLAPPPSVRLLAEPQPPRVAGVLPPKELFRPHPAQRRPVVKEAVLAGVPANPGTLSLPKAPGRAPAPALANFQDYRQAAESQMQPADCGIQPATSLAAPKVSLPGPALPRELTSLQAAGLVPVRTLGAETANATSYGWVARMAVLAIFLTAGLAAAYRVMPSSPATAAPAKPAPQPVVQEQEPPRPANSLARLVEVTGIRFLEVNGKAQIHYLVVNHSSAPLASMTVYVTLRTAHPKPGQPPLARLTFQSPRLAAFEAKEMASPIERVLGPLELPDWQDLRADVDVQ